MTTTPWHFDLHPNMGNVDKGFRYVTATALIGVVLATAPANVGWGALLPLIAIPLVISAIVGWDPVYALFQKLPTARLALLKAKRRTRKAAASS